MIPLAQLASPQQQPTSGPIEEPLPDIEDIIELEPTGNTEVPIDQVALKDQPFSSPLINAILGGIFLLALVLMFVLTRKKATVSKINEPPIPPDQQALSDLRLVWKQQDQFDDKTFASALSDILRRYIEAEFSIRAPELTTEEFLDEAKEHQDLKGDFADQLKEFLNLVDLVKFAKLPLEIENREELYQKAIQFVEDSHQQRILKISPELSMSAQQAG